ncbi:hypothetical protein H5410_036277 [Solanum commersonii]|uniref:DUF7746 domain-containing protein n=1 Tax=Solanum commersonii TaxID=4109 RepID=A0A9J5Y4B5_SOLCO|nr:hypothetical protein H5410_036277 [Solanum commersonii]
MDDLIETINKKLKFELKFTNVNTLSENNNDVNKLSSRREIVEWNIDGLAEQQIYNKLHEIEMAIAAYKMKNVYDKQAATLIIVGFTGTLKNWCDNYLTEDNRQSVLNATATNSVIKNESSGQTLESNLGRCHHHLNF